uniref:Protein kinase domain-containing protein n=2 Tax=Bursaphelenchus xylophilus TaxID=6326 RepID=A0A1I7SP16_BURXY
MKHDESSRDKQKTASAAKKRPNRMDRVSMLGKCQSTLNSVEANTTLSTENIDTSFEKDLDTKFVIQVGEVAEGTEVGAGNFAVVRK